MKVVDSFLFFRELDLLDIRLKTLWNHIDKFILLECDHSFANKPKPLYFEDNKQRFDWAKDKIIHCTHKGAFHGTEKEGELFIENKQRQMLYEMCYGVEHEPDDILLIGDSDEILSREAIDGLRNDFISPTIFDMDLYYYNVKCPRGKSWQGTVATKFGSRLKSIESMRNTRQAIQSRRRGGWHFSYFYDVDVIKDKLQNFAHHRGYGSGKHIESDHILACIKDNKNLLGKNDGVETFDPLPQYVMDEMRKYPLFVGETNEHSD